MTITGIGQDSHRFERRWKKKPLLLGGIRITGTNGMRANSDGDVVLHALTNAISSVTGTRVLGEIADHMCRTQGIHDSEQYVLRAMESLQEAKILHAAFSIECKRPRLAAHIPNMQKNIARILAIPATAVGICATSGEKLTAFGKGVGISAFCVLTVTRTCAQNDLCQ